MHVKRRIQSWICHEDIILLICGAYVFVANQTPEQAARTMIEHIIIYSNLLFGLNARESQKLNYVSKIVKQLNSRVSGPRIGST